MRKMLQSLLIVMFSVFVTGHAEQLSKAVTDPPKLQSTAPLQVAIIVDEIEDIIKTYEQYGNIATQDQGILTEDRVEELYDVMLKPLERIIELMYIPANVFKFLEAKGIARVIIPHLNLNYSDLRMRLLVLTKLLFSSAPTTTSAMIPPVALDILLDIFVDDENLSVKAKTIEILYAWLPDNPKMQNRAMRLKGLEPFYDQIHKLDADVIYTLIKLFNKILNEHLKAKQEYQQKNKSSLVNWNTYNKIGLIEKISTEKGCNGLLNIFQSMWAYSVNKNDDFMLPAFDIMINIQPFCSEFYKGRAKAQLLFQSLLKHIRQKGSNTTEYYETFGLNVTQLDVVLQSYVDELGLLNRDEL